MVKRYWREGQRFWLDVRKVAPPDRSGRNFGTRAKIRYDNDVLKPWYCPSYLSKFVVARDCP
jgi:hypothetical protein